VRRKDKTIASSTQANGILHKSTSIHIHTKPTDINRFKKESHSGAIIDIADNRECNFLFF
jgi:hypothetical protein